MRNCAVRLSGRRVMRWTLLFACFILAACSQERQSRVDTLRSSPTEVRADYSPRTSSPASTQRAVTRSVSAAPATEAQKTPPSDASGSHVAALEVSDQDVARQLIANSLAIYPGSCPGPYNTDRAGRRCGGRSAHSRPGGYAPICFERCNS
jgi:hypothetical protein